MRQQVKRLLLLFLSATLVSSCTTHLSYVSPCLTNPDGDYKDLVTIIGKAECYSKEAVVNSAVTDDIRKVRQPKRYPVVAVYSFQDLTKSRLITLGFLILKKLHQRNLMLLLKP